MMVPDLPRNRTVARGRGGLLLPASLFVLSMAFDYKGAEGGSVFQYAMAAVNTVTFMALAMKHRLTFPRRGLASFVLWSWLAFILAGSAGALASEVPFGQYIRTVYPFVLFAEGFLVAWWVSRSSQGAALLVRLMFLTALISFVFTLWWGFDFSGRGIESIRYQILSPTIPFLVVIAGYDLLVASRHKVRSLAISAAALSIIFLSVTRGMLLVVGMVLSVLLAAWMLNFLRGVPVLPRPITRALGWGALGVSGALLLLAALPAVGQRWVQRSAGAASDVTYWTRVAAVAGQWNQLTANPVALFLGRGFGQSYRYAPSFASLVIPFVSPDRFSAEMWYPGELMWASFLYYGGLLTGTLVITALLWGAFRALRTLTALLHHRAWRLPIARPLWIGVLGYFAFLGLGFTANPFIIRLSALFLGLTLGITLAAARFVQFSDAERS